MSDKVVTLDVRQDIARGVEPFSRIMSTVAGLRGGEDLLLIVPFEPVPLYTVLARQGFSQVSRPTPSGDWEVLFSRSPQRPGTREAPPAFPSPASLNEPTHPRPLRGGEPDIVPTPTVPLPGGAVGGSAHPGLHCVACLRNKAVCTRATSLMK